MNKYGDGRLAEWKAARADHATRRFEAQLSVLERQVRLARDRGLPLIVQLPPQDEAERRMVEVLVSVLGEGSEQPLLISAFQGRPKCIVALLKLFPCLYVGFSGLLTHSKLKDSLAEVAFDTPLTRIVLESVGPRYPPSTIGDKRGSFSHPAHVALVAAEMAAVKRITAQEVLDAAWQNSRQLFLLPEAARES